MKQVGLLPNPQSCSVVGPIEWRKSVRNRLKEVKILTGGASERWSVPFRLFKWQLDHWNNLFTSHSFLSFYDTQTTVAKKELEKTGDSENRPNRGWRRPLMPLMPRCISKPPRCHWRCPVMRGGLSLKLKLYWTHFYERQHERKKVSVKKCCTSSVFHTTWMWLPRRRHSLFLCRSGLRTGARTLEYNFAPGPEISALHTHTQPEKRRVFVFPFKSG